MFFDDLLRLIDLVLSSLASGLLGWGVFQYARQVRAGKRRWRPHYTIRLFTLGYFLVMLAGAVIEVLRLGERITLFTPIHLVGAACSLVAMWELVRQDAQADATSNVTPTPK
jgi:hypothetical protein